MNAKTFAQAAKLSNANGTGTAVAKNEHTQIPNPTTGWITKSAKRNKLANTAPYKRGNATVTDQQMTRQRPHFMNNKCLVIRGIPKGITRNQCINYIDKTDGRKINILHLALAWP